MYGHDTKGIRSRYDYYYSVSSPSLSQAASYYEKQASLFGEPIAPLLPPPIQRSPSPKHIQTPLTPFNTLNASTPSSASMNYVSPLGTHPPMIENFDNHLYESIRRNIMDQQNNNNHNSNVTNSLAKHQLWTQNSNSSSNSPPNESTDGGGGVFEGRRKRASTAFGHYKSDDDVSQNKYRTLSAHGGARNLQYQMSTETASDTDNNNKPTRVFHSNSRLNKVTPLDTTSNSSSTKSKLNVSISHSKPPKKKQIPPQKAPYTMVKSKSDLNTLKTYPDSFTIVISPKRSPSAGYHDRSKKPNEEDEDSIMEYEWVKPPPEMLYEAAKAGINHDDEPVYIPDHFGPRVTMPDHFGSHVSMPTSPIITDKVMIGSSNRVPPGSFHSHKRIAFAIINDHKDRKTRMLQHRHSDDNMSLSGRFSPYSRYIMQRELSAPALNRVESYESDEDGFYYFVDENGQEDTGRQTSIGFGHEQKQISMSMSNLSKPRPKSEMRKNQIQYMSTPNFIKINKRAVIQSAPMDKINPRLILHRSLKGVLKVYNNNIRTGKKFSVDNMDIFLANGKVDPNLLAAMPINVDDKRSSKLTKHQLKAQKQRLLVMKRRKLSPIAGTPHKDSKDLDDMDDFGTPKRKMNTPKSRMEERLKKDKFGRLVTPKKASLPNFRSTKKSSAADGSTVKRKKSDEKVQNIEDFYRDQSEMDDKKNDRSDKKSDRKSDRNDKKSDRNDKKDKKDNEKDDKKSINFIEEIQARSVLGRTIKAKLASNAAAKKPAPLNRQPSKQSIESYYGDKPALKKKSSFGSLKSFTGSIKTLTSFRSNRSGSMEDEEAEAGDEITKLKNLKDKKDLKTKVKGSLLSKSKIMSLGGRLTSASKDKKDNPNQPPSRTGSMLSLFRSSSKSAIDVEPKTETPTKKSETLRAPSASSIMSMTTAAITSNPLNTTLTITNQLSSQGFDINEKKRAAERPQEEMTPKLPVKNPLPPSLSGTAPPTPTSLRNAGPQKATPLKAQTPQTPHKTPMPLKNQTPQKNPMPMKPPGSALQRQASMVAASHPDADRSSMASNKTNSSHGTNASQKPGSRITSAKNPGSAQSSAGKTRSRRGSFIGAAVAHSAIRFMRKQRSSNSIKDDGTQLTMGAGNGTENYEYSTPMAGEILEQSQKSLERVQQTVDKATSQIHQTINENLTDLKTLEKKLSKGNLLEHDANNNNVEKGASKDLSRHSTKLDMVGTSKTGLMDKDGMSVNAISTVPDSTSTLRHQESGDSNQMNSSTSSSMNEMTRKRKLCGLSSCCGKTRSDSAQMIAGKSTTQPLTMGQKCGNCCCMPFRSIGNLFKRRKVDSMDTDDMKPSLWERMCCCCGCCRRCRKKGEMENMEKFAKKMTMQKAMAGEKKPSCWSRMNCFKCCLPCCSKMRESCCCSSCCRKKQMSSEDSLQSDAMKEKDNSSPGTCTRIFCFCCVCCRKKPEDDDDDDGMEKRPSVTSQKGNCCSRMCDFLLCCRKKKKLSSRRMSMLSKKQSIATNMPIEDQKPKLDMVLVEHASLMKGAIPVLPVCLAYFLLICNIFLPGTGTIISGFLCLCIGIPRFSQHDGARGRIGSFIINWIVGVSQAFTIIFCFVGWGWSIWWGLIMLQAAKRFRRIRNAERVVDFNDSSSGKSSLPGMGLMRKKSKDVEKGSK